jgi:hypothetical protein
MCLLAPLCGWLSCVLVHVTYTQRDLRERRREREREREWGNLRTFWLEHPSLERYKRYRSLRCASSRRRQGHSSDEQESKRDERKRPSRKVWKLTLRQLRSRLLLLELLRSWDRSKQPSLYITRNYRVSPANDAGRKTERGSRRLTHISQPFSNNELQSLLPLRPWWLRLCLWVDLRSRVLDR